jgi:fructose-1,6-bisphosphatase/inositol monophosphatase family enzyme
LCEKAIREKILEKFPGHAILGEEAVAPGVDAAIAALEEKLSVPGWLWIVDPVRDVLAVCTLVDLSSSLRHLH